MSNRNRNKWRRLRAANQAIMMPLLAEFKRRWFEAWYNRRKPDFAGIMKVHYEQMRKPTPLKMMMDLGLLRPRISEMTPPWQDDPQLHENVKWLKSLKSSQ